MSLQVALYAASIAIVALAAVLVHVLLRFKRQLEKVVTSVERFEAEIVPLARETRLVVDRLRDVSERVHRQWMALERLIGTVRRVGDRAQRAVDVAGGVLLAPVLATNRTGTMLRVGATTFLKTLWTGRRPPARDVNVS